MCGLAGFFGPVGDVRANSELALRMARTLSNRGPDAEGSWADPSGSVAFGHVRLSIQDLTAEGSQPMRSESGRYTIAYNGEIYNFRQLMTELEKKGHMFRGHSDTEVILAAVEEWGIEASLRKFVGMFAFALWDARDERLTLARDRIGIKPLYFSIRNSSIVFASELKAFRLLPGVLGEIDPLALAGYLRHSYVPAPRSIYKGIKKLRPGSVLHVTRKADANLEISETVFWSPQQYFGSSAPRFAGSYSEALDHLDHTLRTAVGMRMIADVPLGAFLSGGIDSSIVVALMQAQAGNPVKTYSIGFSEADYDEARWAKAVAGHLGCEHHELYVSPEAARAIIPDLPEIFDEPFADSSQIPTVLVSRLARSGVKVVLSGDGGDELFAGYKRYELGVDVWRRVGWMPHKMRRGAAGVLDGLARITPARWNSKTAARIFEKYGRAGTLPDKFRKAATVLRTHDRHAFYQRMISHWPCPSSVMSAEIVRQESGLLNEPPGWMRDLEFRDYMMAADIQTYLPDDILVKVDRSSMSVGLEARVPLLDHRIAELAWSLPMEFRVRNGQSKVILRDLLARYLPTSLFERPKMGFGVPIGDWLCGPLRDWANDLLAPSELTDHGLFQSEPILERWRQHCAGERNWQSQLWAILMFQSWLKSRAEFDGSGGVDALVSASSLG